MSVARDLFEKFKRGGGCYIESIVGKSIEDLYLDCKLTTSEGGRLSREDKKSFAKAASAFANADGGVILWGVQHKRNAEGLDCVIATPGVSNCEEFGSALADAVGQLLGPPIDGCISEVLTAASGRQFLITLIPRGTALHMARAEDQHCFFLRTGSGTHKMETFEVAARFGRLPAPVLHLGARLEVASRSSGPGGSRQYFKLIVSVDNLGLGLGRHPSLSIQAESSDKDLSITPSAGFVDRPSGSHSRKASSKMLVGFDTVLYPQCVQDLAIVNTLVTEGSDPLPLTVRCALFHEGVPVRARFRVTSADFELARAEGVVPLQPSDA